DEERTAAVVARALTLEEDERGERMRALHGRVQRNDVFHWGDRFLAALEEAAAARGRYSDTQPQRAPISEIREAYLRASRRLLILDYDGTLVPFADLPHQAAPPAAVLKVLASLAADSSNCVALSSGRRTRDMDQWFGMIQGLWLIAEHGA